MKVNDWEKNYRAWVGTAAELAVVAQEVIEIVRMKDPDVCPNERLIRHYVQMGVLNRPLRKGRESHFTFQQLAQYLVARNLALDGWPLAKIAEFTQSSNISGLLYLIPKPSRPMKTGVGKQFSNIKKTVNIKNKKHRGGITSGKLQKVFNEPYTKEIVEIKLSAWCKIHLDKRLMQHIHIEEAEQIGKKITTILSEIGKQRGVLDE